MANRFDQFDETGAARGTNRFDQFDDPPKKKAEQPPPSGGGFLDTLDAMARSKPMDFVRSMNDRFFFGGVNKLSDALGLGGSKELAAAKERSPYTSAAGGVAGDMAQGALASAGVGAAIPALGKLTIPSIMGNAALASGGQTLADDAARGNLDAGTIGRAGTSATLGAILGPVGAMVSRIAPGNRVRAAGADLTQADRDAAAALARTRGVPLRADEAVEAVAPARSSRLSAAYNTNSAMDAGSRAAADFERMRLPQLNDTVSRVVQSFGPGPKSGAVGQDAAKHALQNAKDLIDNSADPLYKKAASNLVKGVPNNAAIREARDRVAENAVKAEHVGRSPSNQIKNLDMVQKELQTLANKAEGDGFLQQAYGDARRDLLNSMDAASPNYATARDIQHQGRSMLTDHLAAGPLGTISSSTKVPTQANALFNVNTQEGVDQAVNAIGRLRYANGTTANTIPEQLLSARVQAAEPKNPLGFGQRAFPSEESVAAARAANPSAMTSADDVLEALRAVKPNNAKPHNDRPGGPGEDAWQKVRNLGSGSVTRQLSDPDTIQKLGVKAPSQMLIEQLLIQLGREAQGSSMMPSYARRDR